MNDLSMQFKNAGGLLQALNAVHNVRALSVLLISFVVAALLIGVGAGTAMRGGSFGLGALGLVLGFFAAFVGFNGAGIVLMDESRAYAGRSFGDVWIAAIFAALKFIVVALGIGLGILLLMLVVAVVFWICKIPYLGPLLFAFALPAAIIILGMAIFGSLAATFPVALPALWSGDGIVTALARVSGVVRSRLPNLLILLVLLMLLAGFVGFVVFGVLLWGWASAGSLAITILGGLGNLGSMGGMGGMGGGFGAGAGSASMATTTAGLIGGAVATAIALVLPVLVQLKGFGLIYLSVAEDIDTGAVEARMRDRMAQVKQKAEEARQRVQQQNTSARQGPSDPKSGKPTPPPGGTGTS